MAKVTIDENTLTVALSLADKILAAHGSLTIPLEHVVGASVEDQNAWTHMWHKVIGTSAPPFLMAGTFWLDGGLAFVEYHDGKKCLVIKTVHETYKEIVLQPDAGQDPHSLADEINKKVAA
ncbi:MAG TPA: hypothetical protein VFL13_14475 [Candidatus Baltobacteraceae bacterium]|nr:hypothetical protein [Candidatus Baltobacteraceae bacterium]